ncbi:carotenoid 1,2-hydratase [Lentisalinibacter salinarum]|uniref:carotenoid 1,2-hydratase n=1 Tax=Lentisalinibacter salinarum TaxID=2992239 RepID=UPI003863FFBF
MSTPFPPFDAPVPADGYRWWYVDAMSADGRSALTLIAFVGSVFSPWYAMARRRAPTDPLGHCTLNAVLYRPRSKRWAFTERRTARVERSADEFRIGPSRVRRDGDDLLFEIDEVTVPVPTRLRGTVRVRPEIPGAGPYVLDTEGRHHWQPLAPRARVEVDLSSPASHWSGSGYLDSNWGDDALERDFVGWNWSRMDAGQDTAVLYDAVRRDGSRHSLALRFAPDGGTTNFEAPPAAILPATGWRVARTTRAEEPGGARVLRTLEDTPFYARSIVEAQLFGETLTGIHESLSLDRFASPWVQCLLPFRAPRR